jgi:hypothetical protein
MNPGCLRSHAAAVAPLASAGIALAMAVLEPARGQGLEPGVADLMAGAAAYVQQFSERFATLVGDEQYTQSTQYMQSTSRFSDSPRAVPGGPPRRRIQSEVLLVWLPSERSWLTARNVRRVDGKAIADSGRRLEALLADSTLEWPARVRRLRDEGARFNIGRLERNFADPNTVLQFLDTQSQRRFDFTMQDGETVGGTPAWRLAFKEKSQPTMIRVNGRDVASSGEIWVADADHAILRTRLTLTDSQFNLRTTAAITVSYRFDDRLGTWVPGDMRETYEQRGQGAYQGRLALFDDRIEGVATYTNFRRFETAGRVIDR